MRAELTSFSFNHLNLKRGSTGIDDTQVSDGVRLPKLHLFLNSISIMDEQINIKAEWTPPFKPEETHRERQERHEKHQRMLQDHRDAKALRQERHKAGFHKHKIPPNCLI